MKTLRVLAAAAMLALSTGAAGAGGSDSRVFIAYLNGGNELPALGDTDAFGVATVTLVTPASLCYSIVVQNILAPTAAHIHAGAAGTAGAVVVALPLVPAAVVPTRNTGCVAVAAATITAIRNAPHNFYVNVHNVPFPGGAARGQLQ